ncbi:anaphase-promoting complex subunit 2-like [Hibiscus syriacus]|uniref:Anaphase-promoting complex subunit 2-like n=1 Tax=Hibiscus syriacus TaxID=106335 RepID=A0A6A2WQR5_HIBSY|nr:anaphase-promoting complex subunit 2-like [Hibiscus syriacus]
MFDRCSLRIEVPSKRQREETQTSNEEQVDETKRHKSYNHILSLLEAEEDEPSCQDVSSLITNLQQHLSSESVSDAPCQPTTEADGQESPTAVMTNSDSMVSIEDYTTATSSYEDYEDGDKEHVIRHLLEASDDELGIPNRDEGVVGVEYDEGINNGGNGFAWCDELWELEDETANYYTLLQSQLFM